MSEKKPKMCIGLHVKYLLLLSDCNETRNIFEKSQKSNLMKIRPVRARYVPCVHTDTTKLTVTQAYENNQVLCSVKPPWLISASYTHSEKTQTRTALACQVYTTDSVKYTSVKEEHSLEQCQHIFKKNQSIKTTVYRMSLISKYSTLQRLNYI